MSRTPARRQEPAPISRDALLALEPEDLDEALYKRSGLPGQRANVALLDMAAEALPLDELRRLSGSREEYLAMVGAAGVARAFGGPHDLAEELAKDLDSLAVDPRWRVRDAVARGLQKGADEHAEPVLGLVEGWADSGDIVLVRTAVETVCEPRVLENAAARQVAVHACERAMALLAQVDGPLGAEERSLAATMSYAWSIVVLADPDEVLPLWHALEQDPSPVVKRIVSDNVTKTPLGRLLDERG